MRRLLTPEAKVRLDRRSALFARAIPFMKRFPKPPPVPLQEDEKRIIIEAQARRSRANEADTNRENEWDRNAGALKRRLSGTPYERPSIACPACGMRSWHSRDVEERYCGNCHRFHADMTAPDTSRKTSA